MRGMIARALKIFCAAYLIGGLATWARDIKTEADNPDDYSIILPNGQTQFNTRQFIGIIADQAIPTILLWPAVAYLEAGLRMGWICKSAEIGRC